MFIILANVQTGEPTVVTDNPKIADAIREDDPTQAVFLTVGPNVETANGLHRGIWETFGVSSRVRQKTDGTWVAAIDDPSLFR